MAKLNWQSLAKKQSWQQLEAEQLRQAKATEFTWMVGKHKGQHVKNLPLQYLCWASENLTDVHRAKAELELIRRYNTTHKVGRPDSNTAVEKPIEI